MSGLAQSRLSSGGTVGERWSLRFPIVQGAVQVWRARSEDGEDVVIKRASAGCGHAERLRAEAASLGRVVGQPYLPVVLDSGDDEQGVWFAMRDHGEPLAGNAHVLSGFDDLIDLGVALFSALATLHAADVVHGDIKPHNVLWDSDFTGAQRFTLIDLDICVDLEGRTHKTLADGAGSMGFIAPEMALSWTSSGAGDVYCAAALVLVHLHPEHRRAEWKRDDWLDGHPWLDLNDPRHRCLLDWLRRCVRLDRSERPDAHTMRQVFTGLQQGTVVSDPRARSRWPVVAAGVASLVGAGAVWAAWPDVSTVPLYGGLVVSERMTPRAASVKPFELPAQSAVESPVESAIEPVIRHESPEPRAVAPAPTVASAPRERAVPISVVADVPAPKPVAVNVRIQGASHGVTATLSGEGTTSLIGTDGRLTAHVQPGAWTLAVDFSTVPGAMERTVGVPVWSRALTLDGAPVAVRCDTSWLTCDMEH